MLSFLGDSWRKKPGKEAVLQGSLMLKGVSWSTQNFRWILRLVCDLGALHSAHTVASPSAEKGEAGLQSSWCQLSYHTYLWDVRHAFRAPWPSSNSPRTHLHTQVLAAQSMNGRPAQHPTVKDSGQQIHACRCKQETQALQEP